LTSEEYQALINGGKNITVYRDNLSVFEEVPTDFQLTKAGIPSKGAGVDFDFTADSDKDEEYSSGKRLDDDIIQYRAISPLQDYIEVELNKQLKRKSKYIFYYFKCLFRN
jgi:hypothetical protein